MSESLLWLLRDASKARRGGPAEISRRRRARLAGMVAFAREESPYYREIYRGLPERVEDPALLPVTSKKELMARFDDWVTDRDVTIEKARAFVADPDRIGERFVGKYLVATTSGITGPRGIFVLDDRYWAVSSALMMLILTKWLTPGDIAKVLGRGMRFAQLIATGGHYMSFAANSRTRREGRRFAGRLRVLSVQAPLSDMVARLNEFDPALMWGYASVVSMLAGEQEAGRLRIKPVLLVCAAEGLAEGGYDRIAGAFGSKVRNLYGGTESGYAAYGCAHGWLHVVSDWVVLEPVDADHRPTPPGAQSHTVLLSNLANRVQPILRYDLGDSVLVRPDPCPCGDPLPAIRVQGRAADVLAFPTGSGEPVGIAPLAFGSLVDRTPGVELFQIVQTAPTTLRVCLRPTSGADPERAWRAVLSGIAGLLASHGLGHVTVERATEPPEQSPGGKYRTVIPGAW